MGETEELIEALTKNTEAIDRLLETTQNLFIFQALEAGLPVHPTKSIVGVSTDRVTRISKLRPKKKGTDKGPIGND